MYPDRKEGKITRLLAAKPERALELLIDQYLGFVYAIIRNRLGGPKEDIEECVNDVFLEFYQKRDAYDPAKGSLLSYLAVIACRRAIDRHRLRERQGKAAELLRDMPGDGNANVQPEEFAAIDEIIQAIRALGEPESSIVIRRCYLGQSAKEIARDMRMKPNTVDQKFSRSVRRLRQALGRDEHD